MNERPKVIIVRETLAQSIARDAITFGSLAALIGLGVLLGSSAMQWVGALMAMVSIITRANGIAKRATMTTAEARAFLDRLDAGGDQ